MSLTNLTFLGLVFPGLLLVSFIPLYKKNNVIRKVFLLLVSLALYALCEPLFIALLMAVIVLNYLLVRISQKTNRSVFRYAAIILDVITLLFFKYINSVAPLFTGQDWKRIAFPIGLSYFIFKAISYVVDSKDKKYSLLDVGLYISNFLTIVSGPLFRFENEIEYINNTKEKGENSSYEGFGRIAIGLSKKIIVADSLSLLVNQCFAAGDLSVLMAWVGAVAYSLQLYFDFSGYTDIAIGVGKFVGFDLIENFNYPYMATSVSGFWKRWHISLTQWFTKYIYIPLGGSRVNSKARHIFNLAVVWVVTGMWHGSKWTFIVWALIYFVLQAIEKYTGWAELLKKIHLNRLYTLIIVCLCWVIFRADSVTAALHYIKAMFVPGNLGFASAGDWGTIKYYCIPLALGIIFSTSLGKFIKEKVEKSNVGKILYCVSLILLFLVCMAITIGSGYSAPLYAEF